MTLLEVRSLVAGYHGVAAVHELDLTVDAGEVVALLGPNGAGKTTTLLTLAGELPALGGEVRFDGEALSGPLHRRARRGIALVTEERCIFRQLTVQENIAIGRGRPEDVFELAPELHPLRDRKAGVLSGGEQQILALARALAARPRLLLADELSLGLAPQIADRMLRLARRAADAGVGVLVVEQQVARALAVSDRAAVLRRGRVRISGTADDLRGRVDELTDAYAFAPGDGGPGAALAPSAQQPPAR